MVLLFLLFLTFFTGNQVSGTDRNYDIEQREKQNCYYLAHYEQSYDRLIKDPGEWLLDDSCGLGILELTRQKYLRTKDKKYLKLMNEICRCSDGCVSEAMDYEIGYIMKANLPVMIRDVMGNREEYMSIEKFLVFWVSNNFSRDDLEVDEKKFMEYIDKLLKKKKIGKAEYSFLVELMHKAADKARE